MERLVCFRVKGCSPQRVPGRMGPQPAGAQLPCRPTMHIHASFPSCFCVRQGKLLVAEAEVAELQEALAAEEAKHAAWRDENIRRRHNYIPFLFEMLKEMARRGQLQGLIDTARAGKGPGGQQGAMAMNLG